LARPPEQLIPEVRELICQHTKHEIKDLEENEKVAVVSTIRKYFLWPNIVIAIWDFFHGKPTGTQNERD